MPGKILLVDDISISRYRLAATLTKHGFTVIAQASGPAVFDLLKKEATISLVITDGVMSGCKGLDIIRACQNIERYNDHGDLVPPVVVLMTMPTAQRGTQVPRHYQAEQATTFGFADVLLKPISEPALLKCVRNFLSAPVPAIAT